MESLLFKDVRPNRRKLLERPEVAQILPVGEGGVETCPVEGCAGRHECKIRIEWGKGNIVEALGLMCQDKCINGTKVETINPGGKKQQ